MNHVRTLWITLLLLSLLLLSMGVSADNTANISVHGTANTSDLWSTVEDAYTFCLPLVLMDATLKNSTNTGEPTDSAAPVNQLFHHQSLATADSKNIVTPNDDTVYSEAFLDLNRTALVLVKPETDRFCSVEIMDAYTNAVEVIGSGEKEGDPGDRQVCLITNGTYQGTIPAGMKHISMPSDMAWILVRTICNGPDDLPNITAIQRQFRLEPPDIYLNNQSYTPPEGHYSPEYDFVPVNHVLQMSPSDFFNTANQLMLNNSPSAADTEIVSEMRTINVGPGLSFSASVLGDDADTHWNEMIGSLGGDLNRGSANFTQKLGSWVYYGDPIAEFGTEYAYRAKIALDAIGANPTYVAIYPRTETDSQNRTLTGAQNATLHMAAGMLPPVLNGGFWSVTAYGSDNFLIPNEINRYCVNDRTNLSYNPDGSLDILLQADAPAGLSGNWLPVGDGKYHLILRMYLPDTSRVQGNWTAPVIHASA